MRAPGIGLRGGNIAEIRIKISQDSSQLIRPLGHWRPQFYSFFIFCIYFFPTFFSFFAHVFRLFSGVFGFIASSMNYVISVLVHVPVVVCELWYAFHAHRTLCSSVIGKNAKEGASVSWRIDSCSYRHPIFLYLLLQTRRSPARIYAVSNFSHIIFVKALRLTLRILMAKRSSIEKSWRSSSCKRF